MATVVRIAGRGVWPFWLGTACLWLALFGPAAHWSPALEKEGAMAPVDQPNQEVIDPPAAETRADSSPGKVPQLSAGLADILLLAESDVSAEVMKAFIQNSAIAYHPSAQEVIALKERGVPSDVIVALLQRGTELRAQRAARLASLLDRASGPGTAAQAAAPSTVSAPLEPAAPLNAAGSVMPAVYPPYSYNYWWTSFGYPVSFYWPVFLSKPHHKSHFHHRRPWAHHRAHQPWSPAVPTHRIAHRQGAVPRAWASPAFPTGPHWGAHRFHVPKSLPGPHWGASRGFQVARPLTGPHWGANRGFSARAGGGVVRHR